MLVAKKLILALDLGTSGAKVALVTMDGEVLGWEFEPVALHLTPDGGAEQDPQDWWRAFLAAAQRLLVKELAPRNAIVAVCCSTQGEGTVAVDRSGRALLNCILWMDMRGAPYLKKQMRGRINLEGVDIIKLLRLVTLTGGAPSMTGKDPAGHMLLIRDRFPQVYEKTYKFLNVLDFLNLRLTGRFTATPDSILTSWVTDNRDLKHIHYDPHLVSGLGLDADKLPDIAPCCAILGPLLPDVADALDLDRTVQVVAGAIDNTAAAIGSGAVGDFEPHLYIGTSSWISAHVPYKKTDLGAFLASVPCAIPNRYLLTALQATAGGNLDFLKNQIFFADDELAPAAPLRGMDPIVNLYDIFDRMAGRVPPGSRGLIYTPWIWGERAPVDDPALRAGFFNLSLNHTRAEMIRAVLEGVALNTRWLLAPVEKFLGRKVEQINLVGGGGRSAVWSQIFADVLNVTVRQVNNPIEANARGAAWIGAVGLGEISFADIPRLIQYQHSYQPQPLNRTLYDDRFALFVQIYRQMRGLYHRLNL